jgi:hypothetical protein
MAVPKDHNCFVMQDECYYINPEGYEMNHYYTQQVDPGTNLKSGSWQDEL